MIKTNLFDSFLFVQLHQVAVSTVMKSVDDTFQYPYNELFLWAVLTKRHQMALFFWERGMLMSKDANRFLLDFV